MNNVSITINKDQYEINGRKFIRPMTDEFLQRTGNTLHDLIKAVAHENEIPSLPTPNKIYTIIIPDDK